MKTNSKLIRLVLASCVGSVLWAGCASSQMSGTKTVQFDPGRVSAAPVDSIYRRPDTHPEWRSGLWQYGMRGPDRSYSVSETTVVTNPNQNGVDSTYLLVFNPEVINVAATPAEAVPVVATTGPEGTIVEAAGAERPAPASGISPAQDRWAGGVITTGAATTAP